MAQRCIRTCTLVEQGQHPSREGRTEKPDICCSLENVPVFAESDQQLISDFEYTPSNVLGPGLVGTNPQEVQYCGCSCKVSSCGPSCSCLKRFGPNYTASGKLLQSETENKTPCQAAHRPTSKPIFECNASCKCGEECVNRLVQNGIRHKMEVFRTHHKGWGLRVLESIEENAFVCEYAGEVLTREEAKTRMQNMTADNMNYIFVLKENFGGQSTMETFIDARLKGSIARFINHSCEPNLFLVAVRVHNEVPRVAMFAGREIKPGEELSYEYCGNVVRPNDGDSVSRSENDLCRDQLRKLCMCESPSCQKYLPSDSSIYSL